MHIVFDFGSLVISALSVMDFCRFKSVRSAFLLINLILLVSAVSAFATTRTTPQPAPKQPAKKDAVEALPKIGTTGAFYYEDGNRVTGKLVAVNPRVWILDSDRFGRLTIPRTEGTFIEITNYSVASMPESVEDMERIIAMESDKAKHDQARADQALVDLTADEQEDITEDEDDTWMDTVWRYIRPWKGRLSGFAWTGKDSGEQRTEYYLNLTLNREWTKDRLEADLRYDFRKKNGLLDKRRATMRSQFKHRFTDKWFLTYTPYIEYDGYFENSKRINYILTQQQMGTGYYLLEKEKFSSTIALTYNYFAINTLADSASSDGNWVPAIKLDNRILLPWSFEIAQRGQMFFLDLASNGTGSGFGIENEFEILRKFTNNFSLTLRHEYRIDYPALNSNDYDRLRVLFNYEF